MSYIPVEETYKGFTLRIEHDESAESPRTAYDNVGTLIMHDRDYMLPDEGVYFIPNIEYGETWADLALQIRRDNPGCLILGVRFEEGRTDVKVYSWDIDDSIKGLIYVTREKMVKEWGRKIVTSKVRQQATDYLKGELELYGQYVSGDCWAWSVTDPEGNEIESCAGYYGDEEWDYMLSEARNAADYEIEGRAKRATSRALSVVG